VVTEPIPSGTIDRSAYVEDSTRAFGILVKEITASRGKPVIIEYGIMQTNDDGERFILFKSGGVMDENHSRRPLGMPNKSLGGSDWNYDPLFGAGQQGVEGGVGLNNIGKFVCAWGRVTFRRDDAESSYFTIDDGSGALDDSGNKGVGVIAYGYHAPALDAFVRVQGASSCRKVDGKLYPVIRLSQPDDISPPTTPLP
jgi:hypothetical protein